MEIDRKKLLMYILIQLKTGNFDSENKDEYILDSQIINFTINEAIFHIFNCIFVIFTTDKILITQLFGPQHVASYDVVFKLFSVITIVHGILMAPLWSAYSDAYHRNDMEWIKKTIKNQLKIYLLIN